MLEFVLRWCLTERDRETISGDLLEEYREAMLPQFGHLRANLWYMRQLISFFAVRSFGGPTSRAFLTWTSTFTALAGVWLAVMENVLKHPGHTERSALAAFIVIEALATVLLLICLRLANFKVIVELSAVAVGLVGAAALIRIINAPHFEGFVFLIGSALIVQGAMAIVVLGCATPWTDGLTK